MVKIFIVYGGREGEGYGTTIRNYFKQNNIGSFLASEMSPDIPRGTHAQDSIDKNLLSAQIAIIIITPELRVSGAAMDEIRQILQLSIPFVPYRRKESDIPSELIPFQYMPFDPAQLGNSELKELEIQMWRTLDASQVSVPRLPANRSIEVSYIG